jgi:hypothetical protein
MYIVLQLIKTNHLVLKHNILLNSLKFQLAHLKNLTLGESTPTSIPQ